MKCKRSSSGRHYFSSIHDWEPVGNHARAVASCAYGCGEYKSLGPSDETDERVAIEIKLAAHIQEVCCLFEPKDQDELIARYVEGFASQAKVKEQMGRAA